MCQMHTQDHEIMVGGTHLTRYYHWAGTEAHPTGTMTFKAVDGSPDFRSRLETSSGSS
jgi:hypothetical protein